MALAASAPADSADPNVGGSGEFACCDECLTRRDSAAVASVTSCGDKTCAPGNFNGISFFAGCRNATVQSPHSYRSRLKRLSPGRQEHVPFVVGGRGGGSGLDDDDDDAV